MKPFLGEKRYIIKQHIFIFGARALSKIVPSHPTTETAEKSTLDSAIFPLLMGCRACRSRRPLLSRRCALAPGRFSGSRSLFRRQRISDYFAAPLGIPRRQLGQLVTVLAAPARRLLPALFALIIAVMVYAVIFLPDEVASLRVDVLAAFTYVTNWYLIAAQQKLF